MHRTLPITCSLLVAALLSGCVERRIWIDSEPSGALVWVNHAQVGRTPVDLAFTHEGTYDIRLEKEGYEPLVTPATTNGPIWDSVPLDFFVEILPVDARNEVRWKFTLTRRDDSESALVSRAEALRTRARGDGAQSAPEPNAAAPSQQQQPNTEAGASAEAGTREDAKAPAP